MENSMTYLRCRRAAGTGDSLALSRRRAHPRSLASAPYQDVTANAPAAVPFSNANRHALEHYTREVRDFRISLPASTVQMGKRVTSLTSILLSVILILSCTSFSTFDQAFPLLKGQNIEKSIYYLGNS
jgi:hypothetical protein